MSMYLTISGALAVLQDSSIKINIMIYNNIVYKLFIMASLKFLEAYT